MAGSIGSGMRNFASSATSHPIAASTRAVTAALVASVTWRASPPAAGPPDRVQATQLSTVPKQSSPRSARDRSGSTSSRMAITLVADAFGASRIPSAWRTRQVPTVRRVLPADTGRDGLSAGALPHNARRSLVGDPDPRDRTPGCERGAGGLQNAVRHASRVELDQTGSRRVRQQGDAVLVLDGGVGSHNGRAHTRRPDVDDENAPPARAHAQGAGPNGEARPNFPGLRMPLGSRVALRPPSTSNPEPSARGRKRERLSPMPW